jgi:hypothetical protein
MPSAYQVLAQETAGDRAGDVLRVVLFILGIAAALLAIVGIAVGAFFLSRWIVRQGRLMWSVSGGGLLLLVGGYVIGSTPVMLAGGLMLALAILVLVLFAIGEML